MNTEQLRVLLVDDDPFVTNLLTRHLETEGINQIQVARNTSECLVSMSECDIVILDYWLMEENGIDILREIKSKSPDLPVIFLSGQEFVTIAIRSLKYGAFDYLEKNKLNFDRLIEVINSAMLSSDKKRKVQQDNNLRNII